VATDQTKATCRTALTSIRQREINMALKIGRYRHYKGNEYEVIGVAKHSEDETELVVYRPLYGSRSLWVRPLSMFIETVQVNGETKPRFKYVKGSETLVL
jgi:hypothetical protein